MDIPRHLTDELPTPTGERKIMPAETPPAELSPLVPPALSTERNGQSLADRVEGSTEHDVCGTLPDLDIGGLAAVPARHSFDPANYFLGLLTRACESVRRDEQSIELRGLRWPMIIEGGAPLRIFVGCKDAVLRPFCLIRTEPGTITPVVNAKPPSGEGRWMRAEDVRWNVALWTSRGRLPAGTNPNQPVQLTAWPNFTRVATTPHAMKIAALWTLEALSPIELAERLRLPQRVIFSFYSAASAANLVTTIQETSTPVAIEPPPRQRQGLFSRILRTLSHAR